MKERARIIVGVLSGRHETARRDACRRTWMTDFCQAGVPAMFLLGGSGDQGEAHCNNGDELILPCPDDYSSLPQKTKQFCRFALAVYDFDYLFKCDDDTFVQVDRFVKYDQMGKDYIGVDPTGERTFNSGGAGYFLSRRAVEIVAEHLNDRTGPEDLLVGKLLTRHGIVRTEDPKFQAWKLDRTIPTPKNDGITVHYVRGDDMQKIHQAFKTP